MADLLPLELWYQIFLIAGIKATATARLVSRELNGLCKDNWLWKLFVFKSFPAPSASLADIAFPSGVTPSWFEYHKILTLKSRSNYAVPPGSRRILLKMIMLGDSCAGGYFCFPLPPVLKH